VSRFYIKPNSKKGDKIYVDGEEAHHILDVMRLQKGERVTAFDGTGKEYTGTIKDVVKKGVTIEVEETKEISTSKDYNITLAQSIPRKEKVEYIIEKATELGVDRIIPMTTRRTVVKLKKEKIAAKQKRWEKIAREASKQSGRNIITKIEKPVKFEDVLKKTRDYDLAIMPSVGHMERQALKILLSGFSGSSILVFIGPEGGFDPAELDAAVHHGIKFVSLGENILKCDTAALATIAMINYALSDL
jgi:16S rRNA (uracil1498-N3)-methyltransferase